MKQKFTIVMADDDIDDQHLMKDVFKNSKTVPVIYAVYDGIELLDLLLQRNKYRKYNDAPDLILLDLNMPLMDGFEALKQIKSSPKLKDIPVYIISTSKSEKDKKLALEMGANGFYHKGSSSRDIHKILKEVCVDCFM